MTMSCSFFCTTPKGIWKRRGSLETKYDRLFFLPVGHTAKRYTRSPLYFIYTHFFPVTPPPCLYILDTSFRVYTTRYIWLMIKSMVPLGQPGVCTSTHRSFMYWIYSIFCWSHYLLSREKPPKLPTMYLTGWPGLCIYTCLPLALVYTMRKEPGKEKKGAE